MYAQAVEAANFIRTKTNNRTATYGVICGSGLGGFADRIQDAVEIPTTSIPHFKQSTVEGHAGTLVFGNVASTLNPEKKQPVFAVKGRLHTYEGHSVQDTVFVVRVLAILGVKTLVVTNAAGGVNQNFKVGDLMVISDHINLPGMCGVNPLRGPNFGELGGPRFLPTNNAYSHDLRHKLFTIADDKNARQLEREVHEGVYIMLTGPTYESGAEVRLIQNWGADAVGMSSVPEVLTALHSGMEVLGLSLITNVSIGTHPRSGRLPPTSRPEEPNHAEVVEVAGKAAKDVEYLVTEFVNA